MRVLVAKGVRGSRVRKFGVYGVMDGGIGWVDWIGGLDEWMDAWMDWVIEHGVAMWVTKREVLLPFIAI